MISTNWSKIATALASSLFSFYNLTLFSMMNVLSIYLTRDYHFTQSSIGFLSSWDLWGNVIGFIPIGLLLDRYPIRCVGLTLLSLAIIATLGIAFTQQLWLLCCLRFLQGIASAGSLLILMRLGTHLFPEHTNKTIGLMIVIALSGGIAGNSLFAYFATWLGLQAGLLMIAGLGCLCLLVMFFGLHDNSQPATPTSQIKYSLHKHHIMAGLHIGLLNTPVIIFGSLFGNQYLMHHAKLTLDEAASVSSLIFLGIMFGSPIVGMLADKADSYRLLLAGYIGLIGCLALLLINNHLSYAATVVIFICLGIACCTHNLIYPLTYQHQLSARSTAMAVASLIGNALGALLQIALGILIQFSALKDALALQFLLLIIVLGLFHLPYFCDEDGD
jgi:MFS family permease